MQQAAADNLGHGCLCSEINFPCLERSIGFNLDFHSYWDTSEFAFVVCWSQVFPTNSWFCESFSGSLITCCLHFQLTITVLFYPFVPTSPPPTFCPSPASPPSPPPPTSPASSCPPPSSSTPSRPAPARPVWSAASTSPHATGDREPLF